MISAEEILREYNSHIQESDWRTLVAMRKFAQLHVEAALNAASEQAKASVDGNGEWISSRIGASVYKDSILNAYPKENIK
jgi:hypothetical protein